MSQLVLMQYWWMYQNYVLWLRTKPQVSWIQLKEQLYQQVFECTYSIFFTLNFFKKPQYSVFVCKYDVIVQGMD